MTKIIPTNGRIMWYHPDRKDMISKNVTRPLAAVVCDVIDDDTVTLVVWGRDGSSNPRQNVPILDPDGVLAAERVKNGHPFAQWMPYQLGQAARTEAAEKRDG